eukprot:3555691-Amphidinium_carterae.1
MLAHALAAPNGVQFAFNDSSVSEISEGLHKGQFQEDLWSGNRHRTHTQEDTSALCVSSKAAMGLLRI